MKHSSIGMELFMDQGTVNIRDRRQKSSQDWTVSSCNIYKSHKWGKISQGGEEKIQKELPVRYKEK